MIRFKVAPYALFDVLKAFENQRPNKYSYEYVEYGVTKEDGELVVYAEEVFPTVGDGAMEMCCPQNEDAEKGGAE